MHIYFMNKHTPLRIFVYSDMHGYYLCINTGNTIIKNYEVIIIFYFFLNLKLSIFMFNALAKHIKNVII